MASVILSSVGASVGNAVLPGIGGALLGGLGGSLGNVIDAKLGIGSQVTGPRLENLSVLDSRYGAGIPIVYGNARVAGNVIWSTDLIETAHTSSVGGKGGSGAALSQTTYTYSLHCAVGICAGAVAGIKTIWADSAVIYQNGVWTSGLFDGVTIYTGADDQSPDAFMQSILGAENVPAHRGLAYIVFDNLQLAKFGNRMPNLTFEISATAQTNNPECLGTLAVSISQRAQTVQNGSMLPIAVQSNGTSVQTVLIGGYVSSGSTARFSAALYDVKGEAPALISSADSATFAASSTPSDSAWALSPDKRFIACYIQNAQTLSHTFAIYDMQTQAFGATCSVTLAQDSLYKQIAWIDAQHFVIDNVQGGIRGLHVFARAGTSVVDLGFTALWGTGSSSTTSPLYGAQFTPYADGLISYTLIKASKTLQARTVAWRNNALALGTVYSVAANMALGSGSGMHARFVQTAAEEWTLVYGTVLYFCLMSFVPSASSAAITRPLQRFTQSFGTGTTNFPAFYGDRLLIAQSGINGSKYLLSEVRLDNGSFSLTVDAAIVSGLSSLYDYFHIVRLDGSRLLFIAQGGQTNTFKQTAIFERNAVGSVGVVLSDILSRAGYEASDYDVSAVNDTALRGYIVQEPMSARSAIEPLQVYAPFDLIEASGQLKTVLRGASASATVASDEWRAAGEGKPQPPPLLSLRAQEMDLPREVAVDVIDPSRNFEVNCQRARRLASPARAIQKIALPVVCAAADAKRIAETKLYTAWAERELVKLCVSRAWMALDPADVIDLGNGETLRIAALSQSGGLLTIEGFYCNASSLDSEAVADGGQNISASGNAPVPSILHLMDLPPLQDTDDQPGVYAAATGLPGWKSASLLRSADGATYAPVATLQTAAVAGIATTALAEGSPYYQDNAHTVTVQTVQGTLSSCSWAELANGANAALLGNEIVQFQTATLAGPGLYVLGNLLRGRRGTEDAAATHAVGERFILLQTGAVTFVPTTLSERGNGFSFRALSFGQCLSDAQDYAFSYGMKTICPMAPVNIRGTRSLGTGGDLTLTWRRRARMNAQWADYIDVPLDEPQELYEVRIMNGASVVRALTGLAAPTATYTAAQQTEDWGGTVPSTFTVDVCQVSARYGNGAMGTAVV